MQCYLKFLRCLCLLLRCSSLNSWLNGFWIGFGMEITFLKTTFMDVCEMLSQLGKNRIGLVIAEAKIVENCCASLLLTEKQSLVRP